MAKKFNVSCRVYFSVEVEADNADEAFDKANAMSPEEIVKEIEEAIYENNYSFNMIEEVEGDE